MADLLPDKKIKSEEAEKSHQLGLAKTILEKTNEFAQHLDHQTNILIGVGSAIFLFAATEFDKDPNNFSFLILAVFSAVSALMALYAVHPPRYICKKGQSESLMYHKRISDSASPKAYAAAISKAAITAQSTLEQYTTEIYNVSKYYYQPKRAFFHGARNVLFIGLAISFVMFLMRSGVVFWP
jgi:hypothetical protein